MTQEEKVMLKKAINEFYNNKIEMLVNYDPFLREEEYDDYINNMFNCLLQEGSLLAFINNFNNKKQLNKILIKNEYGLIGNMLYKYRNVLSDDIIRLINKKDKEALKSVLANGFLITEVIASRKIVEFCKRNSNDKKIAIAICVHNAKLLKYFSDEIKNDKDVLKKFIFDGSDAIKYVSPSLRNDKRFMLSIIRIAVRYRCPYPLVLKYASNELQNDRDFVLRVIKIDPDQFRYAKAKLKNNREFMLKMLKINGIVLRYANEDFKKDKEMVIAAIRSNSYAFNLADYNLIGDNDVLLEFIVKNLWRLKNDSKLVNNRELMLKLVKRNGMALKYVSFKFRDDREMVLTAVKKNGCAIRYANKRFKNDIEIAKIAVSRNVYALNYISKELRTNENVLSSVKDWTKKIKCAPQKAKNDKEMLMDLLSCTVRNFREENICKKIRNIEEVVITALKNADDSFNSFYYIGKKSKTDEEILQEYNYVKYFLPF